MAQLKTFFVEVAYALPDRQCLLQVEIENDATIETAIYRSGILAMFPDIDLTTQKVGIFGKELKLSEKVHAGDRVEIYRPLSIDPKEARRIRAIKN
jgi:putative ubiquitin-RnfH superfamily antitoxin RatB of RatAB toxin-antitoxin module